MRDDVALGYLLAVCAAAVWTPRPLVSCLDAFGDARELARFARGEISAPSSFEPLPIEVLARIAAIDDRTAAEAIARACERECAFVVRSDPQYPARLLDLCDPPPVLYYRGSLASLESKSAAVVGSRASTPYGRSMANAMASDFAGFGVLVVSGLARGIDASAHRGCTASGAATVAVIGSGLQTLYPPYHAVLADEIVAGGGAIVTEFPPCMSARPHHFPMRNRLVAALADATVVVEASYKSGALITARLAADLGRPVFAVPGDIGRATSEGTHALIKDGAALTTSAADMCAVLGWPIQQRPRASESSGVPTLPLDAAAAVLHVLSAQPLDAEEISRQSNVPVGDTLAQLTLLEIRGLVERQPGGFYVASAAAARSKANAGV